VDKAGLIVPQPLVTPTETIRKGPLRYRRRMTLRSLTPLAMLALAGGCAPEVRLDVPASVYSDDWSAPAAAGAEPIGTRPLGLLLGSPELDAMIAAAVANNAGLKASEARADQAAALLTGARAAALPVVTGSLQAGGTRSSGDRSIFSFKESFAAIDASFDPDLFGRNRAIRRAAAERYRAAGLDRAAAGIAITAQVALAYVQRGTLARRLGLLDASIVSAGDLDRIMRIRQREGDANRVDVGLQAIRLKQLQSERTRLSEALGETRTALAVLTGAEAPSFTATIVDPDSLTAPSLSVPLPADLIARRPDLLAADARLQAAGGDVDAARRAFYPSFGLSVGGVATTVAAGPLVPIATLGADLLASIFSRSRLKGDLALSAAQQREAAQLYRQAVLEALRDVEDALSAIRHAREREALLAEVEAEARTTSGLARRQYLEGDADLQQLLDAQDLLIAAQDARALARQELLAATIALYAQTVSAG